MNAKILYWKSDPAGQNIMKHFRELGLGVQEIDGAGEKLQNNIQHIEHDEKILYLEELAEDADAFIVPSTHKSVSGEKSLTIHATGNFGDADFGGEPRKLCATNPAALAEGLRGLAEAKLPGYNVCMEVTHHGPTIDKPIVFIEIGSGEAEWKDEKAGEAVAGAIKRICENKKTFENYIGFGGPHYAPSFSKLVLENPKIAIGHILPSYHNEHITKDIVQQMLEKSNAKKAVFDWKGIKSEARNKVIGILDELGVEWCKTSELH